MEAENVTSCVKLFSGDGYDNFRGATILRGLALFEGDNVIVEASFRGKVERYELTKDKVIPDCTKCKYRLECLMMTPYTQKDVQIARRRFLNEQSTT